MSLDDRVRQLSETIIQEARGPIEVALHRLLADVMTFAAAERDQAVQAALAEAAASHESALAAVREEHERQRVDADALRAQFDRELDAALSALREKLDRERESAILALRESLAEGHAGDLASLRAQLEQEHADDLASLRAQLDLERDAALAAAAADVERVRDAAFQALREGLEHDHEAALKAALQAAGEESDRAHRAELEAFEARAAADRDAAVLAVREEIAGHEASAVSAARTEAEAAAGAALTAALAAAEQGKLDAESRAAELERERDVARSEAGDARQAVLAVEQKVRDTEQQAQDAEARLRDADQRARDHERTAALVHVADRQQDLECSDRTLVSFRRLDAARSLTEVLLVLADQAAVEIGRVALLTVHGTRLRGWDVRGLPGLDPASIDSPVEPGSAFALAIESGLPVSTADAPLGVDPDGLARLLAIPPGRVGLAVPLTVGGRVVAILYADDGGDGVPVVPSSWPEIAEILARHAGHRLEVLTVSHAAVLAGRVQQESRASGWPSADHAAEESPQADERREEESARRYARLLISEIKLYNEAAVEQGRQHRDLLSRLGADIERARRLYEDKIPAAVRQRADCFDQEVVRTLAGGDPGLLGQTSR